MYPTIVRAHAGIFAELPDPTAGEDPPFADKAGTLVHWVFWSVSAACLVGLLVVGAKMAVIHNRGQGGGHFGDLAMVAAACIVIGGATGIVGAMLG